MLRTTLILLGLFSLSCYVLCQIQSDEITSLPLYNGQLGTQYSGYITLNGTKKHMHYWFVESFSSTAETDPVVLWLNGGPGCSSMDGFFYEQGPIHFDGDNLTLYFNPNTWTLIANVIFLEAPVGVGFSYSDNTNDYNTNDTQTAEDNHQFLRQFFEAYPKYKNNKFWIAGESYAGIYVPSLAQLVSADKSINFQGIMVGNGVTDYTYDGLTYAYIPFAYGMGLMSPAIYQQAMSACANPNSQACANIMSTIENNVQDIDVYNTFGDCWTQRPSQQLSQFKGLRHLARRNNNINKRGGVVPPCTDAYAATEYLNRPDVKNAIHVDTGIEWAICTDSINYDNNFETVVPIYQELIKGNYDILVYSGSTDGAVPYTGTYAWISSLQLPIIKRDWDPWYYNKPDGTQVGGYVTEYQGLTFTTVHGSGHMVPQFRPEAAFHMFKRFINGNPL